MKKILQIALICAGIGIIAASSSCSSVYDATPDVPGRDTMKNLMRGDMTAAIDGVIFTAQIKSVAETTADDGVRTVTIRGTMDSPDKNPENNQTIVLSITNYTGPNTYLIQPGILASGSYILMEKSIANTFIAKEAAEEAYITITGDGDNLEGSFRFVVAPDPSALDNNINITNGYFNVPK